MKEVGLNTSSQAQGPQRMSQAQGPKRGEVNFVAPTDSVEANLSRTPDFSQVEQDTEARFDMLKSKLRNVVNEKNYPPLETIERLSRMLATPDGQERIDL